MSHAIYQTRGIILKTKNMRESNKLLTIYTEKFGIIYCSLQSVRELKSKMRFHTNVYSLVTLDVVRGRDIWRITGIHEDISSLSFVGTSWYTLIHKFSQLLLRLSSSEEVHPEIWDDLLYLFDNHTDIQSGNVLLYEIIFTIRTLNVLGYWQGNETFLATDVYSSKNFEYVNIHSSALIQTINQRLHDTQL